MLVIQLLRLDLLQVYIPLLANPMPLTATALPGGNWPGITPSPFPKQLKNEILKLEFVEMYELLPENWPDTMAEDEPHLYATLGKKKSPVVTNILRLVECYSSLVSVEFQRIGQT